MRAGRRNVYLTIEDRSEDSIDSVGDPVVTWSTYSTQWAEVITQGGKEFLEARQQHSSLSHIVRTRFVDGVHPTMRINNGGEYYNILAVYDPSKRRETLTMYCDEQT